MFYKSYAMAQCSPISRLVFTCILASASASSSSSLAFVAKHGVAGSITGEGGARVMGKRTPLRMEFDMGMSVSSDRERVDALINRPLGNEVAIVAVPSELYSPAASDKATPVKPQATKSVQTLEHSEAVVQRVMEIMGTDHDRSTANQENKWMATVGRYPPAHRLQEGQEEKWGVAPVDSAIKHEMPPSSWMATVGRYPPAHHLQEGEGEKWGVALVNSAIKHEMPPSSFGVQTSPPAPLVPPTKWQAIDAKLVRWASATEQVPTHSKDEVIKVFCLWHLVLMPHNPVILFLTALRRILCEMVFRICIVFSKGTCTLSLSHTHTHTHTYTHRPIITTTPTEQRMYSQ